MSTERVVESWGIRDHVGIAATLDNGDVVVLPAKVVHEMQTTCSIFAERVVAKPRCFAGCDCGAGDYSAIHTVGCAGVPVVT